MVKTLGCIHTNCMRLGKIGCLGWNKQYRIESIQMICTAGVYITTQYSLQCCINNTFYSTPYSYTQQAMDWLKQQNNTDICT